MLITNTAFRSTDLQSTRSEQAREKDAVRQAKAAESGASGADGDHVALSGTGAGSGSEVQITLRALRSGSTGSSERIAHAKVRLESGFYDKPEVLREIASRIQEAFRSGDVG